MNNIIKLFQKISGEGYKIIIDSYYPDTTQIKICDSHGRIIGGALTLTNEIMEDEEFVINEIKDNFKISEI